MPADYYNVDSFEERIKTKIWSCWVHKKLSSIITLYSTENSSNVYRYLFLNFSLIKYLIIKSKDTNRKIRKTDFIYICGFKNGSSSSTENTGEVKFEAMWAMPKSPKGAVHVLQGVWNQNLNTVIYEKCCSCLSISIFIGLQ